MNVDKFFKRKTSSGTNLLIYRFKINDSYFEYFVNDQFVYSASQSYINNIKQSDKPIHYSINLSNINKIVSTGILDYRHEIKIGNLYNSGYNKMSLVSNIEKRKILYCDLEETNGITMELLFYSIECECFDAENKIPEKRYYHYIPKRNSSGFFALNIKTQVA